MLMGVLYDLCGRKLPIIVFMVLSTIAYTSFPFLKNESEYYVSAFFLIPLPIISSNPFVPDLIHEASHGVANMLRTNMINIGNLAS